MNMNFDGKVYNPLGGGSYVFYDSFLDYIESNINKKNVKISIGVQPNSSPHFGTLVVFLFAFGVAEKLNKKSGKIDNIEILLEVVDTAPGSVKTFDGIEYQKNLKNSNVLGKYFYEYIEVLNILKKLTNIDYKIRMQNEFNNNKKISNIIKCIIDNKESIVKKIDPKYKRLRIRSSCPLCGLADKKSVKNIYNNDNIKFYCPLHGYYDINIFNNSGALEYNTPLRNLVRGLLYLEDNIDKNSNFEWIRMTGSDYAGFYQEELLYKSVELLGYKICDLPMILYAPLIVDWSGAKLSKSLYVKEKAYNYLPDYMINYRNFKNNFGESGINKLYKIVSNWIDNPYKLFRSYSIYYFMEVLKNGECDNI